MNATASAPACYRLRLFGAPALLDPAGHPASAVTGKSVALLCYLVLRGGASRDELLGLLWGDMDESRARNACRQALHRIRRAAPGLLDSDGHLLRVTPGSALVDVLAFHNAIEAQEFEQAAHIYTADLFEAVDVDETSFLHWCDGERQRFRAVYHSVLVRLTEDALQARKRDVALRWARLYRKNAPSDASGALLEAKVLSLAGRRQEAATVLDEYVEQLRRDYDLPEPPQIGEARKRFRSQAETAPDAAARKAAPLLADAAPFVGRDAELQVLLEHWKRAGASNGRVVSIAGSPGVGKTRLASEFAEQVGAGRGLVVWGSESAPSESLPYGAIAQALRGLLRAPGISGASEHLLAEAARLVPELRDRFRLPTTSSANDEAARLRLFEGVAALIDAVAFEQPVCIILDHVERAVQQTLDLLRYLQLRLSGSSVLLLLLADEQAASWTAQLGNDIAHNVMELSPLTGDHLELLADTLGCGTLPGEERRRVIALSEGVPGRLKEVLRRYLEGRPLVTEPVELSAILAARLAAASGAEKRLYAAAALLGPGVPVRVLAAAAHVPEPAALSGTLAMREAGLISDSGAGYEAQHSESLNIARNVLGEASIVLIAGWSAEAIEYQKWGSAVDLARLYRIANRPADAFRALRKAADDALAVGATAEALGLLEDAAALATDRRQAAEVDLLLRALRRQTHKLLGVGVRGRMKWPPRKAVVVTVTLLLMIATGLALVSGPGPTASRVMLQDTLLLNAEGDERHADLLVTGPLQARAFDDARLELQLPWVNPLPNPQRRSIALERITRAGTDIYVTGTANDTVPLVTGGSDDFALGWSPDGEWLLVARSRAESGREFDTDLYAYRADDPQARIVIDTAFDRRILEAAWSPGGSQIAWVAQAQGRRQIFVSDADGSNAHTISQTNSDDYNVTWAANGGRIGFTTTRFGNSEIAAYEVATHKTWRLTFSDDREDRVRFSPDGEFAAFESSTSAGRAVYIVRSYGGKPERVAEGHRDAVIVGWRGRAPSYAANLHLEERRSDTGGRLVQAHIIDEYGAAAKAHAAVRFTIGAASNARIERTPDPLVARVVAPIGSVVEVIGRIGGWRSDTALVVFEAADGTVFRDDFESSSENWHLLGSPVPRIVRGPEGARVLLASDQQWESGILSRQRFPIQRGIKLAADLAVPAGVLRGRATLALVAPEPPAIYDHAAPQFLRLASVQLLNGGSRIAYSVQREIWTEPVPINWFGTRSAKVEIRLARDRTVEFHVDGQLRWRSTSRLQDDYGGAQLWAGSTGAYESTMVDNVSVSYAAR